MAVAERVLTALESVLGVKENHIPLHEPTFNGKEWDYVKECLDTGWVSSVGKFVDRFERDLETFTGTKKAVAVANGTAALHIALRLLGVGTSDEVLVPALTFVATANAVAYCGAVPHFVDSEEKTLGLDPVKLGNWLDEISEMRGKECYNKHTGRRIKAVVPMHTFGHPVDLDGLVKVCQQFNLELIEDAAESLGSYYKGRHTGNWGRVATLSFNGNKTVTTGGGGAIITNDEELGKLAKHITTTAKVPHKWAFVHDQLGYNYRMPNINAALGCAQLEQLPGFLESKRKLAKRYQEEFSTVEGVRFIVEPEFAQSNYWLNAILVDNPRQRDVILEATNEAGYMTRPAWTLMNKLDMYRDCPRMDLSTAEDLEARLINIPSGASL